VRYRPPAPGRPVSLGEPTTPATLFLVTYEDEEYGFREGAWGRFGRDDAVCEIPVWEEVLRDDLSCVAGELWVADGTLWVRNLSTSHELSVLGDVGTPVWLPSRAAGQRGRACSVPDSTGYLRAPSAGNWIISVTSRSASEQESPVRSNTARLDPVPAALRPVAAALCAPLFAPSGVVSTYDEVAARLDISRRQARRAVERLCDHYAAHLSRPRPTELSSLTTYDYLGRLLVHRGLITREDDCAPVALMAGAGVDG